MINILFCCWIHTYKISFIPFTTVLINLFYGKLEIMGEFKVENNVVWQTYYKCYRNKVYIVWFDYTIIL